MIINGGSRRAGGWFAAHLTNGVDNDRVSIVEIRGLLADTVREALRDMEIMASGTRAENYFYHANINPRADERLTPEQWEQAIDTLEANLGLEGHSRIIVEHEKEGRIHRHVLWSRIDTDSMTAIPDGHNYLMHERTARELERAFGHEPVQGAFDREADTPRPDRRPENWETFRGHESGIDPQVMKAELTELWHRADSGKAFAAALDEAGYILCKGDKRDFCVIDQAGDEHSLARRIDGAKAKDIRERMADVDRDDLPSVAEGRALVKDREDSSSAPANRNVPLAAPTAEPVPRTESESQPAPIDVFAAEVKAAMRENNGEPHYNDGLTFWQRTAALVAAAASYVQDFVKGHWESLVDQFRRPDSFEDEHDKDRGIDR